MSATKRERIVCLSNVYDDQYRQTRQEDIDPCLSSPKRRDLFRCLELATGRQVIVLSFPPRASHRRRGRWVKAMRTRFSTHTQLVCANLDAPKLRVPLSWLFFAVHAVRHIRSGDVVVIDNYELVWVLAARITRVFRRVSFVLDYEDGKHAIDRSWFRAFSGIAEVAGRSLIRAALLAHPSLKGRLPSTTPTDLVPGFVTTDDNAEMTGLSLTAGTELRFLYSGSLDRTRGVDLLLETLPLLPTEGWRLDISGTGPLENRVRQASEEGPWKSRVCFHGVLSAPDHRELLRQCHVGLNCQRSSDPVSAVTFPSKIFSYLSAKKAVLSSRASSVELVCGGSCLYYAHETAEDLAGVMTRMIDEFKNGRIPTGADEAQARFSIEGTAARIRTLFEKARLI